MNRRHAQTPTKSPTLTGGDDQPRAACDGAFHPWDVMARHKAGTQQHDAARRDAAALCARCPLTRCGYRIGGGRAA